MDRITEKFLEYTMPELVHQLTKLNKHLEKWELGLKLVALKEEPIKSVGDMNEEIKEGMEYISRMRKQGLNK